jgi:hypothetical protein
VIVDLHSHTYPNSDDSSLSAAELIERAKEVGLDAVCITDHDRFWDTETVAMMSRKHDFPVIPGCEVTTEEGHLLVFGLTCYQFGMHRASFVRRLVDEAGGAVILAHPYRRIYLKDEHTSDESYDLMLERAARNPVFGLVDAVDVMNGRGSYNENLFSRDVALRFGLPGIGASDAHKPSDVGNFATEFSRPVNSVYELIAEIRAGRFRPVALNGHTAPTS